MHPRLCEKCKILGERNFGQNQGPHTSVSPYTHQHQSFIDLRFEIVSNVVMTHRLVSNHAKTAKHTMSHSTPVSQKTLETSLARSDFLLTQVLSKHLQHHGLSPGAAVAGTAVTSEVTLLKL